MRFHLIALPLIILLTSSSSYAETMSDFMGYFRLIREDHGRITNPDRAIPCATQLEIRKGTPAIDSELWIERFTNYESTELIHFILGNAIVDEKHFTVVELQNNTMTRTLYKNHLFDGGATRISAHFFAILPRYPGTHPDSFTLYLEQSVKTRITSACYYVLEPANSEVRD